MQPGLWRPAAAAEATKIILGSKLIRATRPPGPPVKISAGKVVCIGDYTLAADDDAPAVVRRHGRDDAAAQRALAAYPGLRHAQIVYRDPMAVATARCSADAAGGLPAQGGEVAMAVAALNKMIRTAKPVSVRVA